MDRRSIVVCTVAGFLGLVSALLGFIAEAKRIKGSQVEFSSPSECVYPQSPALALGLTAAVSLMIAQIVINVATGCICCIREHPSTLNWTLGLLCFVISWFTFVLAFLLLLSGASLNDEHGEENIYFGNYYCYVVKPGVFAGAASLSLVSVILGIIYYLTFNSSSTKVVSQTGIAMGQPHPNQDPVFVHQDTYDRRQLS
ncbi:protein MODIFYING WALL LIGNIN-1-like [Bidens hawaiensis]|uniref:protein MODIFYING WALL LIGNIN-1-like n=1 Tax=Bidens hawaiensis TaxID=980011 RepID=UPI00404A3EAB